MSVLFLHLTAVSLQMRGFATLGPEKSQSRAMAVAFGVVAVVSVGFLAMATLQRPRPSLLAATLSAASAVGGRPEVRAAAVRRSDPTRVQVPGPRPLYSTAALRANRFDGLEPDNGPSTFLSFDAPSPSEPQNGPRFALIAGWASAALLALGGAVAAFRRRQNEPEQRQALMSVTSELPPVDPGVAAAAAAAAAGYVGGLLWEGRNDVVPAVADGGRTRGDTAARRGRQFTWLVPPLFPLLPAFSRPTYRYEVVKGAVWTLEQKQGIGLGLNVAVNVRMTLVKLKSGGLLVYAPIAPTGECVALVKELGLPVEHIVLPTTLFEHKIFVGPFSRAFPKAAVWPVGGQWSWPVDLPPQAFGIFPAGFIDGDDGAGIPWADEFKIATLRPPPIGVGESLCFNETVLLHVATKTLLVTDAVVRISDTAPEVITERDLLESADDDNLTLSVLKLVNLYDARVWLFRLCMRLCVCMVGACLRHQGKL